MPIVLLKKNLMSISIPSARYLKGVITQASGHYRKGANLANITDYFHSTE